MGTTNNKQAWLVQYRAKEYSEHTQSHYKYAYGKQINVIADDVLGAVVKAQEYSESVGEIEFKVEAANRRSLILVPAGKGVGLGYQVTYSYGTQRNRKNGKVSLIVPNFFAAVTYALGVVAEENAKFLVPPDQKLIEIHDVNYLGKYYYS